MTAQPFAASGQGTVSISSGARNEGTLAVRAVGAL
jgi:hypothetical protein